MMKSDMLKYPEITNKELAFINSAIQRGNKVYIEGKDAKTVIVTEYKLNSKLRVTTE